MAARRDGKTVAQAVADIGRFHQTGCRSLKKYPDRFPMGKAEMIAAKSGKSGEQMRKARELAREFSIPELNELCGQIECGGFPLGVQHVVRLLRLPRRQRGKFLKRAIAEQWSYRELATAIKRETGRRSLARRIPSVGDRDAAVQRLLEICRAWRRLRQVIDGSREKQGISVQPSLGKPIRKCDLAIHKLDSALDRLRNI